MSAIRLHVFAFGRDERRHAAAAEGAHADDEHGDAAIDGPLQRLGDFAAPELAVGDGHEQLRVGRAAVELLVLFDHADAPVDPLLQVRVPGRLFGEPERRFLGQVVEEEEERVGIGREAHLRRGHAGKERQRNAVALPGQRIREQAEEPRRALPAIAGDVLDPHRGRAVEQDHQIDAALPHDGGRAVRTGEREHEAGDRGGETQPEGQVAGLAESLRDRQHAARGEMAHVRPALQEPPDPEHREQRGQEEQPEPLGLAERDLLEVDAGQHASRGASASRLSRGRSARARRTASARWS